jgi:ATP-dependent phosphofructokinase / diphosphate-dependent phosphofructokinase
MRIGLLTGDGDCPALNAVISAVVRQGVRHYGYEIIGFRDGWHGVAQGTIKVLKLSDVERGLPLDGAILRTGCVHPYQNEEIERIKETLEEYSLDGLIVIGGEETLRVASVLSEDGVFIVGVPKTIENSLSATDYTIGFDTAVQIAIEAIDRLHTTAESHHRVAVVEVAGHNTGWIALESGMVGGANVILTPERPFSVDAVCRWVTQYLNQDYPTIIVVAEGAVPDDDDTDAYAFGDKRIDKVGIWLADEIAHRNKVECRAVVVGDIERGSTPTSYDRRLAIRFGMHAVDAVHEHDDGVMVALRGTNVVRVKLVNATAAVKVVPRKRFEEPGIFFG